MTMDRWIVIRMASASQLEGSAGTLSSTFRQSDQVSLPYTIEAASDDEIRELRSDPDVIAVAPDLPVTLVDPRACAPTALDDARLAGSSWGAIDFAGLAKLDAGRGVSVAVLDTGIDTGHVAFKGVTFDCKNYTSEIDPSDLNGHGTHCAGTIFGRDVEGVRIGVARGIERVFSAKVLDSNGRGSAASIIEALHDAHAWGANIISLSVGIDFSAQVDDWIKSGMPRAQAISRGMTSFASYVRLFDRVSEILHRPSAKSDAGCVVVAAAGNSSRRSQRVPSIVDAGLPAAAENVISVGAYGINGSILAISDFSCSNPSLAAPGENITSAKVSGGLVTMSGTSMAAPHVAGLAAIWWSTLPSTVSRERAGLVRALIRNSCLGNVRSVGLAPSDFGEGIPTVPQ